MAEQPLEKTQTFSLHDDRDREVRTILSAVYQALVEKGYDHPIDQLVGYILSDDPTYITSHKNARALICRIDRYELLDALLKYYLGLN